MNIKKLETEARKQGAKMESSRGLKMMRAEDS